VPVAYRLQPPVGDTTILFPVTFVLSDRTLVKKGGSLIPDWKAFTSAEAARAHLDDCIRAHTRAGYTLVETRKAGEEIAPEHIGSDLTVVVDAEEKRITAVFHKSPTAEILDALAARLRKHGPRCLRVVPPFSDVWSCSRLAKALLPSLEAFIFDSPSISQHPDNTLGDISDVLEACPRLTRACIMGCSTMHMTRHEHLRELHLLGSPLHPSVMMALAFPALEKLVLHQEWRDFQAADLAKTLRSIAAPGVRDIHVGGVPVLEFLTAIGKEALPWNLHVTAVCFDDVASLFEVLKQRDALRLGKLRLCADRFFDGEIAQLKEMGVIVEAFGSSPQTSYSSW
jgi:hypothetical protein